MPEFFFAKPLSPAGLPAVGTVERAEGIAQLIPVDPNNLAAGFDYEGTTDHLYDTQVTTRDGDGRILLTDEQGNTWYSELLDANGKAQSKKPEPDCAVFLIDNDGEVSVGGIGTVGAMAVQARQWLLDETSGSNHTDLPVADLLRVHDLAALQTPRPEFKVVLDAWNNLQPERKHRIYIHVTPGRFQHAPAALVDPADASKLTDAELAAKVKPTT